MNFLDDEIAPSVYLVRLSGPLNLNQAAKVSQHFSEVAERGAKEVVLDLSSVPFIDSRGLAALIAGHKIFAGAGRNFYLIGLQDQPRLLFELTGFDRIFQIFASVAEVMAAGPHSQSPTPDFEPPVADLTVLT